METGTFVLISMFVGSFAYAWYLGRWNPFARSEADETFVREVTTTVVEDMLDE